LVKEINVGYFGCFMFAAVSDFCSGLILLVQTLLHSKLWHTITRPCLRSNEDVEAGENEIDKWEASGRDTNSHSADPESGRYYGSSLSMRGAA
uniref:SSD domain-containing protein n=1 Tax=Echinostoma caproni TaxID=27848 RepID=A0A183B804_9TREM